MSLICTNCNKTFKTKQTLKQHENKQKKCNKTIIQPVQILVQEQIQEQIQKQQEQIQKQQELRQERKKKEIILRNLEEQILLQEQNNHKKIFKIIFHHGTNDEKIIQLELHHALAEEIQNIIENKNETNEEISEAKINKLISIAILMKNIKLTEIKI